MRLDPRGSILAERHSGWDDSGWGGGEGASMFVHETYLPNVNANFPTNGAGRPMIWAGGIAQDGSEPGSLDGGGSSDGSSAGPGPGQGGCVKRGGHPSWQEAMHLSAGYCYIVDGVCYVINEENQPSTVIYRDVQSLAVARENPEPPHLLVQHDNGGRVTAIGMYSATSTGWEEEDPLTYTTNRVGLMEYAYDELGRVWKMTRWEINSGSKGDSVETQYWYDARGRVIKTEGEQLVKSKYDGLGRATRQYILATIDDTDYDDADDLADDIVLQEQIRAYEPGTRDLVLEAVVARFHDDDAAGTEGALDTNADGDELKLTASNLEGRVQIVARWYDNLGRLIEEVAYGTFGLNEPSGPTDFDRDGLSVPTRAADKLRASYEYDSAGELHEITDTRDKTTRYEYDDAGRRTAVILNYTGATTPITNLTRDTDLYTRFKYGTYEADDSSPPPSTDSWVNEVWVDLDGDGEQDAGVDQVTAYTYGVDSNSTPTSLVYGGEFLYEIKYPDSGSATDVVTLGYDRGGKLEHIWDQEGNKVDLDRDDIGRVIRAKPTFAGGTSLSQWVDWLEYSYNGLGLLERVTQAGDSSTVNEVVIEYDGWWLPKTIKQDHNSAISSDHYAVSHLHDDASGGRRTVRRTSSTYPGSNTIDYVYTSAGNVLDGDASRLSKIDFGAVTLATYDYLGVQQVVGTEYPEADVFRRQYGSSGLYPDLDRFGHVVSDRWTKDLATDIDFYDVAVSYDMGSNPTLALDAVHKEIFDWEYTIDGFGRVQQAERGDWDPNATPDPTFATTSQDQLWDYTLLGGWDLHKLDIDGDGSFTGYGSGDLQDKGTLNEVNELTGRNTDNSGGNEYSPTYDALGNLTDDDENYKYKYDIFGRLVEVQDQSGDPVAFYEYDGLGRLIRAWNEDTDTDGDLEKVDDDPIDLVYDERWRLVTVHEDLDADPYELFVHHEAGMDGGGSYIDAMVCRMRDTDTGTAGFEERLYYCQNYRNDVVAIVSDTGTQVEQVRYSAYGVPFGLPAGDTDSDGDVGTFEYLDVQDWINTSTYDVRGDLDLDGDLDIDDINAVAGASGQTLGWGVQSRTAIESRFGYGGYMWDRFVSKNHVRHRAYDPYLGRWLTRDPIGYSAGTMSLYEYVGASPLSYSDPMGLQLIIVEHPWLFPRNPPQAPIVPRDGRPNRAPYDILPGDSVDDILRKQQQAIRDGHKDANRLRLRADDMTCCYTIADGMQELTGGTFKNDWDEVLRETEDAVEDIAIEYATVGLLVCGLNPRNRLSEICDKLVKKNNGKTRVTLPDGRVVDLKGQGHYNKGCGKRIETPHVYHPKQRLHPDKKRRKDVNPATDQDLKDVEDYLNPPDPDPR
jgi:RHS repeat-associated protein